MTERLTDEALLPCPFCGGEAELTHIEEGENSGGSFVCCTQCMASGNVEFGFKENYIAAWNRRATPADDLRAAHDALQCAYALICTPIARRKLGLDAEDERVAMIRAALSQNGGAA